MECAALAQKGKTSGMADLMARAWEGTLGGIAEAVLATRGDVLEVGIGNQHLEFRWEIEESREQRIAVGLGQRCHQCLFRRLAKVVIFC